MQRFLKQSTAVDVILGPFIDDTDFKTPETALTIANTDTQLSKNAQTFGNRNDATSCAHLANGYYNCELDATDTNTLGALTIAINESGALPVWHEFMVVPSNVYDSLVAGTDTLNADVTQWLGTACATPTTAGVPETDVTYIAGTATAATDITQVRHRLNMDGTQAAPTAGGAAKMAGTDADLTLQSVVVSNSGGTAVTYTSTGSNGTGFYTKGHGTGEGNKNEGGDNGSGQENLGGGVTNGFGQHNHGRSEGGVGQRNESDQLHGQHNIGAYISHGVYSVGGANGDGSRNEGGATTGNGQNNVAATSGHGQINTGVGAGKFGSSHVGVAGDIDAQELVDIEADTNELQTDWTNGGRLDLIIDAILVDTGTTIPAQISGLNDLSAAEVNAEVVDVMSTDTQAEEGVGAPTATPTYKEIMMYLYMAWRNKNTTTSSSTTVSNNAGTTIASATISDDGATFTKNEFA